MPLLDSDRTFKRKAKAIARIPSHIILCVISLLFCGLINIFGLVYGGIIGVIAIAYAIRTMIAKKNFDYENAMRYSQFAKVWAIATLIMGITCLFGKLAY